MLLKLRKYGLAVDAYKELLATKQLNEKGQALTYASPRSGTGL